MNWSVRSHKGLEEFKSGDCSCYTKFFKYLKLEYCKANRRKVGMGCACLPPFLPFWNYHSLSSKGKNSVYLTFLAQAFCLLSHYVSVNSFLPTAFPPQLSKSKDCPWTPNPAKETRSKCQRFWSYSPSAKAHTWLGQQSCSNEIHWGQQIKATQSQCILLSPLTQVQVKDH